MEWAVGIPGTIGGAIFMNAGAYKSDMGYVTSEVKVLTPDLEIKTIYNKDMQFHYRTSFIHKNEGYICLEATIVLREGQKDAIMALITEKKAKKINDSTIRIPKCRKCL
jgi:UDP-N-acetylmuramate dehydrogenase